MSSKKQVEGLAFFLPPRLERKFAQGELRFRFAPVKSHSRYASLGRLAPVSPCFVDFASKKRYAIVLFSLTQQGEPWKKHLRKQVLFSTKFAFGEWNMALPCEIATLWNICFANVKRRISFHIERSEIFHNFRKKIISHSATSNISLNSRVAFLYYEPNKKHIASRCAFCYSSRRLGISSRVRVYMIAEGVSHHRRCITPAAWWYTTLRVDDIQFLRNWWYTRLRRDLLLLYYNMRCWRHRRQLG